MASTSVASVGQQITINVMVNASPGSPVDAVQAYLDFDTSVLQVVSVVGGATLSQVLQPAKFDNGRGEVDYAAGTTGDSIESPFTLLSVNFQTTAVTGQNGTAIVFAPLTPPRQTRVAVGAGQDVTGNLTPVSLVVQ
jgi:hypothetical protein